MGCDYLSDWANRAVRSEVAGVQISDSLSWKVFAGALAFFFFRDCYVSLLCFIF